MEQSRLATLALAGRPLEGCLVIDMHGHFGGADLFDIPEREPAGLIAIMDRVGIDVLCVSHLMSLTGDYHLGNDLLADAMRRFPGRFVGYAAINPGYPDDIVPELTRCFDHLGMTAIKVHAGWNEYPIDGPAYRRAYSFAAERGGVPVLGHGFGGPALRQLALDYPGVPFIAAHAGGGYQGRIPGVTIEICREVPNVYVDLCSTVAYYGAVEELVRYVGVEKVLYGSDLCFQQATHQIGRVLLSHLSEREKELILGLNAARLFGIPVASAAEPRRYG